MAKHLKIRGELCYPDLTRVKVTILEQTHFGYDFNSNKYFAGGSQRFIYSKFTLVSNYASTGNHGYKTLFHLPSSPSRLEARNTCTIPVEMWPKLKKAVEAYNRKFSDNPQPAAPKRRKKNEKS